MPATTQGQWVTLEYRSRKEWDAGIYPGKGGNGFLRVHQLKDVGHGSGIPTYPKLKQVCLEHEIEVPRADLDWSSPEIAFVIHEHNEDWITLDVGRSLPNGRLITLNAVSELYAVRESEGAAFTLAKTGPNCTTKTYRERVRTNGVRLTVTAQAAGFASPVFRFKVNGQSVGAWAGEGSPSSSTVVRGLVSVEVPTALNKQQTSLINLTIACSVRGGTLTVDLPSGHGKFAVEITAEASEAPGADDGRVEARLTETVVTKLIWMPNEAIRDQAACIAESIPVPVDRGDWDMPLEDPGWRDLLRQDLSDLTDRRIGPAIVAAMEAQLEDPVTAERRLQALAVQLRVSPDVVAEVGERLKLRRRVPG